MRIPEELRRGIDDLLESVPAPERTRAATEISNAYRQSDFSGAPLKTLAHRLAYLQVRLPATYAACHHVFAKTRESLPDFQPKSLLDLGAGPGTAAWAAAKHFHSLENILLLERDADLLRIAKSLSSGSDHPALRNTTFTHADLRTLVPASSDVIVLSYTLGELSATHARRLVVAAWHASQLLVLIEPGTPKAFERMAEWRRLLIGEGATIAAPCPHENNCPMLARGDWCHFAERLERTAEHRRIKGGSLGYEDEKFTYLSAARLPVPDRFARIVRHPQIHSGYVHLQLCAEDGLHPLTATKSQRDVYRAARKAAWGDRWPPS